MSEKSSVLADLEALLTAGGFQCFRAGSEMRPDLVAVSPERGLLVLDLVEAAQLGGAKVELNRKVAGLRESIPEIARAKLNRHVVVLDGSGDNGFLAPADLNFAWLASQPALPVDGETFDAILDAHESRLHIDVPLRSALRDEGAGERAQHRIILDDEQAQVVRHDRAGVVALTGPPGSGKTLVLAARANWLAEQNPDWRIQVLCFNRMLVPYLEKLVAGSPKVGVTTFGKFTHSLGFRISLNDEAQAARDVARHLPAARSMPVFDALMIDECQDFHTSWIQLAAATVRPSRGGVTIAGDPKQALYRDAAETRIPDLEIEQIQLKRPYRSTRQILEVTSALSEELDVRGRELALEGEPVDLVWGDKVEAQAAAVARDVLLLLQGGDRTPEDIAVLVTRKFHIGKVASQLTAAGVPSRVVYANQADALDLAEPTVKVLTVHSAKGLEFDVVFLVGLENLPNPDGTSDADRQGRTGYVGATRARDQLVLTYSKDNVYLERIRSMPPESLRRWVWPDDYPGA